MRCRSFSDTGIKKESFLEKNFYRYFIHIPFSFSQNSINILLKGTVKGDFHMAKKFGKFLMTTAALGALAASAYYFFWKKDAETDDDFDAEDDFDEFDDDLDEEDSSKAEADRKYVDLDLTKAAENVTEKAEETAEAFKEGLNAAKAEATDKIVGAAEQAGKAAGEAAAKVEEFFDDEK
jgi:hypothetical protein